MQQQHQHHHHHTTPHHHPNPTQPTPPLLVKNDKCITGVQGTFHDGFTARTYILHFTRSHTGIGNHLCLRTCTSHSFAIAQIINCQNRTHFVSNFFINYPNPELCFVTLLLLGVVREQHQPSSRTTPFPSSSSLLLAPAISLLSCDTLSVSFFVVCVVTQTTLRSKPSSTCW